MLRLHTAPAAILTAAQAKARLPALAGATDAVVEAAIAAATGEIDGPKGILNRAIATQTWDWVIEDAYPVHHVEPLNSPYWLTNGRYGWPLLEIPLPPLVSVTHVKYLDASGVEQTFNSSNYTVAGVGDQGYIYLKEGVSWPTVGAFPEAVTVRFVAGYSTVPEQIKQAVCMRAAELVSHGGRDPLVTREDVTGIGSVSYSTTAGAAWGGAAANLLQAYRVYQ